MKFPRSLAVLAAFALPSLAEAHVGLHADGMASGFVHPFSGADHILAMVAVGFWAATLGGKARLVVPAAFVGLMALGGVTGMFGLTLPLLETGIAASVVLLGLLVAFNVKVPLLPAAAIVGLCALFHGQAHGAELPAMSMAASYVGGFLAATILLHLAGLSLAALRFGRYGTLLARASGAAVAIAGAALLAG